MSEHDTARSALSEALNGWVRSASAALVDGPFPGMRELVFTTEGGVTRGEDVVRPDYYALVTQNREALRDLPETDAVLEVARAFPLIGDVLLANVSGVRRSAEDEKLMLFEDHLLPFAAEYFIRADYVNLADKTVVADGAFAQTVDLFAQSIFEIETIPVRWLVQLDNLRMDVDDFELETGVRLRHSTDLERNQALQVRFETLPAGRFEHRMTYPNPARPIDIRDANDIPDVFLEITDHRHLPRDRVSGEAAFDYGKRMLTALRLVQSNDVGIHSIWYVDENPFGRFPSPRWLWSDPIPSDSRSAQTVVTADVENQVREIWPHLAREQTKRPLLVALERLNDSYRRAKQEDRLIDYWVGLEALFLQVKEQELRFRAALLTAQYIATAPAGRYPIFRDIRDSYDLRSKVVHGAELPDPDRIRELTEHTGNALRRSLRKCIPTRRPPNPEQIFRDLLA
jgi:hypothetical protein